MEDAAGWPAISFLSMGWSIEGLWQLRFHQAKRQVLELVTWIHSQRHHGSTASLARLDGPKVQDQLVGVDDTGQASIVQIQP